MNGRIYDAKLGRFLRADPFIQAASDAQMYNRYSYLRNNPLNATDPIGYFSVKRELKNAWNKVRHYVSAIVAVALIYFTGGTASCFASSWYRAASAGAIAGAASAAVNGANLRGVLQGAAYGAVSSAAFSEVGSAFTPTNCGSCYTAAETLKTEAYIGKVAAHVAVGGVMAVLHGGKFGHGFASAGFTQAFSPAIGNIKGDNLMPARVATAAVIEGGLPRS